MHYSMGNTEKQISHSKNVPPERMEIIKIQQDPEQPAKTLRLSLPLQEIGPDCLDRSFPT